MPLPRAVMNGKAPRGQVATVPLSAVRPGESPRLAGEDKAHIARLAETDGPLPPILVDRSLRVIDGMHRLLAATMKGQQTLDVEFFDGSPAEAFLRSVEANVTHGLPLSLADRRAAATRIVASYPQMSDRAIGESTGLAARTVASIRRRSSGAAPQLNARIGRDGRVRPLDGTAGRQRAAELLARYPAASLREVARGAGVSPATVRDVRRRLERGEEPALARHRPPGAGDDGAGPREVPPPARLRAAPPAPAAVVAKLRRDPSLRHKDAGRRLLLLLQANAAATQILPAEAGAVPPHCAAIVEQLARQYGRMWQGFAQELHERTRAIESADGAREELSHERKRMGL